MQSVKFVLRQIGVPNPELDIQSAEEASQYIQYQYGSQGYEVKDSFYAGEVKDKMGGVAGYKIILVLVKNEEEAAKVKAK